MAMPRMKKTKSLTKPTNVFKKHAKKPETDDMPGKMMGGKTAHSSRGQMKRGGAMGAKGRRLKGIML